MRLAPWLLLAVGAGCPRRQPAVPLPEPPPAPSAPPVRTEGGVVRAVADLQRLTGRVTVIGTVATSSEGTDLVLGDGTRLRVQEQGVPQGWEWLVDSAVRVIGTPQARDGAWWLVDPQTPMPADVGIEL